MLKITTLILCSSLIVSNLLAQKNFQQGYIVLNNQDTLKGYIDFREWSHNPTTISFAASIGVDAKVYSITDLQYFEITGKEAYQRFTVTISLDEARLSFISDKKTTVKTEEVFLKELQGGKNIMLYSYTDDLKQRFYIKEKIKDTPEELLNSIYVFKNRVVHEQQYRMQLLSLANRYLPGNSEKVNAINYAKYSFNDIDPICSWINGVKEGLIEKEKKALPSYYRFFVGAGITRGMIYFTGNSYFTKADVKPSYYPLFNGGIDFFRNPYTARFFLRTCISITGFRTTITSPKNGQYIFQLRQIDLNFNPQLNYNVYSRPAVKWFAGAGLGFHFSNYQQEKHPTSTYQYSLQKFWAVPSLQSGIVIRNTEISLLYFPPVDITRDPTSSIINSSLQLRCNYLFNRKNTSQ